MKSMVKMKMDMRKGPFHSCFSPDIETLNYYVKTQHASTRRQYENCVLSWEI
jgi:hypothetical protein